METKDKTNGDTWENICVGCGRLVVTHGGDQPGQCPNPECHGWKWLCRLENSVNPTPAEKKTVETPLDSVIPPEIIMQPLKWHGNPPATPKARVSRPTKKGNGPRGRPVTLFPETVLDDLVSQGFGCKAIARKLTEQGTPVHYSTISRYLCERGTNGNSN